MVFFKRNMERVSIDRDKYNPMFCMESFHFSFNDISEDPAKLSAEELLKFMRIYCPQEIKWS